MARGTVSLLGMTILLGVAAGCGGGPTSSSGGTAAATIDGTRFEVGDVQFSYSADEDGYFRVEGRDAAHPEEDCLPGLGGGLALYGDWPAGVESVADLAGRELPFEFSGDGDDFNLCFVGSKGLLGVERGTVRIAAADGNTVTFSFSGSFTRYDGQGGESGPVSASGDGTARIVQD